MSLAFAWPWASVFEDDINELLSEGEHQCRTMTSKKLTNSMTGTLQIEHSNINKKNNRHMSSSSSSSSSSLCIGGSNGLAGQAGQKTEQPTILRSDLHREQISCKRVQSRFMQVQQKTEQTHDRITLKIPFYTKAAILRATRRYQGLGVLDEYITEKHCSNDNCLRCRLSDSSSSLWSFETEHLMLTPCSIAAALALSACNLILLRSMATSARTSHTPQFGSETLHLQIRQQK